MKLSKLFATISAVAVAATSVAALNVSAAPQIGQAYFIGQLGGDQSWNVDDFASPVAIDGDAQYEVEWTLTAGGTETVQFLAVCIAPTGDADNFTTDSFPNLTASIDEVWIDGVKVDGYTASAAAINTAYYESATGVTRLYLHDEWAGTGVADLPGATAVSQSVKVVFTIAGTGVEGTSNIVSEEPEVTTTTAAAGGETVTTTTTAAGAEGEATTTTAAGNGESSADTTTTTAAAGNAATGVEGVASVLALLTIAGVAVVATKKH